MFFLPFLIVREKMEGTSQTEAINQRLSELQTLVDQLREEVSEQVHARAKESLSSPARVGAQPSPAAAMPKVSRRIRNLDDKLLDCELRDAREGLCLNSLSVHVLFRVTSSVVSENTKLKRKLREMAQRRRRNQLLWFAVVGLAVSIFVGVVWRVFKKALVVM